MSNTHTHTHTHTQNVLNWSTAPTPPHAHPPHTCSYSTLLSCWKELPEERPPFSELVQEMAKVLEGVAGYLDLNLVLDCSNKDSDVMTNGYDHLAEQK